MGSKRRSIQTRFWEDPFIEDLSPSEKLLFLYLLTNPQTNLIGIYEVSQKRIAYDTGLTKETIQKAFERFEKNGKAFYIDNYVILPNFLKNQSLNNNMKQGAVKEFEEIPNWMKEKTIPNLSEGLGNDSESFESIQNLILKMKVKIESKRENEVKESSTKDSDAQQKLKSWLKENYPEVNKLPNKPTPEQMKFLKVNYGQKKVEDILSKMDNYKPLTSKYKDVYLTAMNWLKKDYGDPIYNSDGERLQPLNGEKPKAKNLR